MPPRTTRKSYRPRASDRTMVGTFSTTLLDRVRSRRRRHDRKMNLQKEKTARASQQNMGWRVSRRSLLSPVAGEVFLLTLPFIERRYRQSRFSLFRVGDKSGPKVYSAGKQRQAIAKSQHGILARRRTTSSQKAFQGTRYFRSDLCPTSIPRRGAINPVDLHSEVSAAPSRTKVRRTDEESWSPHAVARLQAGGSEWHGNCHR